MMLKQLNEPIPYKEGLLSIQASSFHYCRPRNDEGPYTHVEVGYLEVDGLCSLPDNLLSEYRDGNEGEFPVYGFVPIEELEKLPDIDKGMLNEIVDNL